MIHVSRAEVLALAEFCYAWRATIPVSRSLVPGPNPIAAGFVGQLAVASASPCRCRGAVVARWLRAILGLSVPCGLLLACARAATQTQPIYPDAVVYERDPQFVGEWVGEVGAVWGILTLGELEEHRYFGSFVADDGSVEYVLLLEQSLLADPRGALSPSNRVTFTWQDGLGGRGRGWLLINREGTALTGSYGYDNAVEGLGDWTLMRSDT